MDFIFWGFLFCLYEEIPFSPFFQKNLAVQTKRTWQQEQWTVKIGRNANIVDKAVQGNPSS